MKNLFFCLGFLFLILCPAADSTAAGSGESLNTWVTGYYLHPEPQKIPEKILDYTDSSLYDDPSTRFTLAAFFATLLKNDSTLINKAYQVIADKGSENSKVFFLNVLWQIDTMTAQDLMKKIVALWPTPEVQRVAAWLGENPPPNLLYGPVQNVAHLDMLWAMFFATGSEDPIRKIISVVEWANANNSEMMSIGGAAQWSLTSNAQQHRKVYEICKKESAQGKGYTQKFLKDLLTQSR
ncbi:MAG: hypothetical protein A2787_00855 [Omnitrophica WOR_2 bacterium RIFCSPHIGHO2_01_FULL_48_9]|nr:MAG: hypothetical protein A3D10_07605 [Omnitrophica WOR_2 bacterium RIFCSPHIGHO2_02_FULL_48_11]OGX31695.1 MAG: hypothetical protein A2787_00855 [Omnitrophica WOR_2 bacterium RIFCSPHIGHO2_01_FULL_48_9]